MRKQLITAGIVTAVSAAGLAGVGIASAATSTNNTNPMSSLVEAIASKFNLNKTDVQAVFDEQHTKMEASRDAEVKSQIDQLVKNGKLTQDQANKINAKRTELDKEREVNRTTDQNLTDAERKAKMEERRTTIDKWFTDNNIPSQYRYLVMDGGRGHGPGGRGHDMGMTGEQQSSSSTHSSATTQAN